MNKYILLILIMCGLIVSCNKYDINNTDQKVGISKVIFFPIVELKGDPLMIVNSGSTFTDPGVAATLNGQPVTPIVSGSVNTSAPGIYFLKYTAFNSLGYSASADRIIIVKNATPTSPDYSGDWKRNGGVNGISKWIQLTPATYAVNNPGGATAFDYWVVVTLTGTTPAILSQKVPQTLGGVPTEINSSSNVSFSGNAVGSTYKWIVNTAGYGNALRTFVKQ